MNSAVHHAQPMHCTLTYFCIQTNTPITKKNTMPIPHYHLSLLLLLLLPCLPPHAAAQSTVADCGPSLLPLAPCGAFVQGRAAAPVESCCDNVDLLYKRNPTCLCALLASSGSVSPFPINVSLALQLPLLCKLNNVDPSTCPGMYLCINVCIFFASSVNLKLNSFCNGFVALSFRRFLAFSVNPCSSSLRGQA